MNAAVVLCLVPMLAITAARDLWGDQEVPRPCSAAEFRQFDFWLGEWDLTWTSKEGELRHGVNRISAIFGGCVTKEEFAGDDGKFSGLSLSTYVPAAGKWKQTWVDDAGSYLDFTGEFISGRMILGRKAERGGKKFLQRMQWYNIAERSLDWSWERSDDDGATWDVIWKIHYTKRSGGAR